MAVNLNTSLLFQMYQKDTVKKNSDGIISQEEFFQNPTYRIEGDKVIITESDGDVFTYDLDAVSGNAGTNPATSGNNEASGTNNAQSSGTIGSGLTAADAQSRSNITQVSPTDKVDSIMVTSTTRTEAQIQADLDKVEALQKEIKDQMTANTTEITRLRNENDKLYDEINNKIASYIDKAEDIAEDKKEEVKKKTQEEIEKFKNGEYKTKEELHAAIQQDVAEIMSQDAINNLLTELDGYIDQAQSTIDANTAEITRLTSENTSLQSTLDNLNIQEAKLQQELKLAQEQAAAAARNSGCDPQGFAVENEDGSTTQYDFFVDRDGNQDLTDASEFLGASRYEEGGQAGAWSEMTELDTNNDGVVDAKELEAGNVMVMVTTTDANGNKTQKAVSAAEAFGENSDLAISTRQNATTSNSSAPANFNDSQYNNTLLGNFNVTLNGQNYTGYQTADSYDYLNDNYSFTSGSAEGASATSSTAASLSASSITVESLEIDKDTADSAIENADDEDLLKIAENICAQNGINFNQNGNSAYNVFNQQTEEERELLELEREFELDFAA